MSAPSVQSPSFPAEAVSPCKGHRRTYENACLFGDGTVEVPPGPPPGCEATIRLRVLSLEPDCWNCDRPALCLAGLHPDKPSPTYWGLFACDVEPAAELARVLADQHGHQDVTRRLKRHFSDYEQDWLWANSCRHCGAVLDDLWFGQQIYTALSYGGMEALQVPTVAECPSDAWQRLVYTDAFIGVDPPGR